MIKEQLSPVLGAAGLVLIAIGASLYAVEADARRLTVGSMLTGGGLLLLYLVLNLSRIRDFLQKRSARQGANMVVVILLMTCVAIIAQAISIRHSFRYDTTRNKRFSLAPQTLNVLAGVSEDLEVFAFFQKGTQETFVAEELLDQFAYHCPSMSYQVIDPDQKPQLARQMNITAYGTSVVRLGQKSGTLNELNEQTLLNAVLRLSSDVVKTIYFVQGHGEKDPGGKQRNGYSVLRRALTTENYAVQKVSLFDEPSVPDDCTILVLAGPRESYFSNELQKIDAYLSGGGNAIVMVDPEINLPEISQIIARYGLELDNDIIIDPHRRVPGRDNMTIMSDAYETHAITRRFNLATVYPVARSVRILDQLPLAVSAQYLVRSGSASWGETDLDAIQEHAVRTEDDVLPPMYVAAIASKTFDGGDPSVSGPDRSQLVVIGDSDFAANSSFNLSGNADFFLNMVSYLAEEEDMIAIRSKRPLGDQMFLTASQGRFIFLLCVVLLPLSVIGVGTTVFVRNKKEG